MAATWPATDSVEDVERVVQRFDPQHQAAREVAQDAAGVRAAATLVDRATRAVGGDVAQLGYPAPDLERRGLGRRGWPIGSRAPVVLVGGAVDAERPSRGGRAGGARAGGEAG